MVIKIQKEIIFFEKAIKFHEELANDEDQDDTMHLNDRIIYFDHLFIDYFIKNNTDQMSEKPVINNSTVIETPTWLKLKSCVLNPQNNDDKCFQYSVLLFYIMNKLVKIAVEYQKLNNTLTILIGIISFFHYKNKIIKLLK